VPPRADVRRPHDSAARARARGAAAPGALRQLAADVHAAGAEART
jgi:hypothetical protein